MTTALLALVALGFFDLTTAAPAERAPEQISVEISVGRDWLPLGESPGGASAVLIRRALDAAGKPFDASPPPCRAADLRRRLVIDRLATSPPDKPERLAFFVGEPILFEMRVEAVGACRWSEPVGGNYRGRGRDDNFSFFVRRVDGDWVADPYGNGLVMIGGGLSTTVAVAPGKPLSQWLALPRWAAIDAPGTYEVFATQSAHGWDVVGMRQALIAAIPARWAGRVELEPDTYYLRDLKSKRRVAELVPSLRERPGPSPLALPPALRARLGAGADNVQDFSHFRFEVLPATAAARADMVRNWVALAEAHSDRTPSSKADAARDAVLFSRSEDFLPAAGRWLAAGERGPWDGLAFNPSPKAAALLLSTASEQPMYALYHLHPAHIATAIPVLIARLDHANDAVRSIAEERLQRWTGEKLDVPWEGYRLGRPTPAEAPHRKQAWQAWWRAHAATFKPR